MNKELHMIDHSAMKVSHITIVALNILAFILEIPWLAALVTAVMLSGTALGAPGFGFIYRVIFKPLGWIKPDVLLDHPEPHRFAQGMGAAVLAASALALFAGSVILGWGLGWGVIALAAAFLVFATAVCRDRVRRC